MMVQIEPTVLHVFSGCLTLAFIMFCSMKAIIEVNTK